MPMMETQSSALTRTCRPISMVCEGPTFSSIAFFFLRGLRFCDHLFDRFGIGGCLAQHTGDAIGRIALLVQFKDTSALSHFLSLFSLSWGQQSDVLSRFRSEKIGRNSRLPLWQRREGFPVALFVLVLGEQPVEGFIARVGHTDQRGPGQCLLAA